jgi:hypothetical protein
MMRRVVVALAALCVLGRPGRAQGLREQLTELFHFGSCSRLVCLDTATLGQGHGFHFIPSADTSGVTLVSFLGSAIGISVSNTPITSASSGTTFRFEGGVPVRTATSAGPVFAERAQTLGRGRWFMGVELTQMNFSRLRGVPLDRLLFNFTHSDVSPGSRNPNDTLGSPAFEDDIVQVNVNLDASLMVAAVSMSYGLADGVDVGVTVPFVRTSISGTSFAQIIPGEDSIVHYFGITPGGDTLLTSSSSMSGSSSGLGDVEGRIKLNVAQTERLGFAVLGTFRFPTGDEDNLLGAGRFSGRGLAVLSGRFGTFNPHVNFGFTVRDAPNQNNSIDVNLGYDALLAPWATMAFDVLSTWQTGESKLKIPPPTHYDLPAPRDLALTNIPPQRDDYLGMAIGFKFRTQRGIQIVANTLFPLRNSGLQPGVIWTGGLEYSF